MKRISVLAASVFLLVIACSTSEESASKCTIEGTYTMTATPETASPGCSAIQTNPGQSSTVTITKAPADGVDYGIEIQGSTGGCAGDLIEDCKIQTKCTLEISDAVDPSQNEGTLQFSWTFDANGFTGINSGAIPKAKSIPDGCTFTSNATGKRR